MSFVGLFTYVFWGTTPKLATTSDVKDLIVFGNYILHDTMQCHTAPVDITRDCRMIQYVPGSEYG